MACFQQPPRHPPLYRSSAIFSTFAMPLSEEMKWTVPEIMLAFSINSAIGPIPMILGGYFADKGWVKWSISIGALLFAVGFYLTGTAAAKQLYLYYGVIAGLGRVSPIQAAFPTPCVSFRIKRSGIRYHNRWYGSGCCLCFSIGNSLIMKDGAQYAFRTGLAYIIIVLVASSLSRKHQQVISQLAGTHQNRPRVNLMVNKNWLEMLKTPVFLCGH